MEAPQNKGLFPNPKTAFHFHWKPFGVSPIVNIMDAALFEELMNALSRGQWVWARLFAHFL